MTNSTTDDKEKKNLLKEGLRKLAEKLEQSKEKKDEDVESFLDKLKKKGGGGAEAGG